MSLIRPKSSKVLVYIMSLLAVVLWSMSYLWSDKVLSKGVPVEYLVFLRISMAGVLLLIYNLIIKASIKIHKKDIWKFLVLSIFEPFIYFVCETYGIDFTESPTISALVIATAPIFSVFAGMFFFKEKISLVNLIGILVCIIGIVLVTMSKGEIGPNFIIGLILLIIAILSEVGHASFTKCLSGDYAPQVIVMYQFLIGSVFLSPLFYFKGLANFNVSVYFSWDVIMPIVYLAIFCSSIAFSLWVNTIKELGVAKSSIFLAIIPVFTAIDCWILGQEDLTIMQLVGITIACFGVILSQFAFKTSQKKISH